jgi:hypothetical protein
VAFLLPAIPRNIITQQENVMSKESLMISLIASESSLAKLVSLFLSGELSYVDECLVKDMIILTLDEVSDLRTAIGKQE